MKTQSSPADVAPARLFPSPQGYRIFIASSGYPQMAAFRESCEHTIRRTLHEIGRDDVKPYSWDLETAEAPFDQRLSMQEGLARPSDKLCLATVIVLGEWMGSPLEDEFDLARLPGIAGWTDPARRYRLLHPWPRQPAQQKKALANGCFPLSGTLFELFDAMLHQKPFCLCVLAQHPVLPGGPDPLLGGHALRTAKSAAMPGGFEQWLADSYSPQTSAVRNFLCAYAERNKDQGASLDYDKHLRHIRYLVKETCQPAPSASNANPYRYLQYYDIGDARHFKGRAEESETAVQVLEQLFERQGEPRLLRIEGDSGSGKSSFLHAGLLARLESADERGSSLTVAFRPDELLGNDGKPEAIMEKIVDKIIAKTGLGLPARLRGEIPVMGPKVAQKLVAQLDQALAAARGGRGARLIIGIDQFEEIVDLIDRPVDGKAWLPLIRLMAATGHSRSVAVVYTLETSRRERFAQLSQLQTLRGERAPARIKISGSDRHFLGQIIGPPFALAGIKFADDILQYLGEQIDALEHKHGGSPLPLLALTLTLLFEHIVNDAQLSPASQSSFFESAQSGPITLAQVREHLDLQKIIGDLAEKTWREASADTYGDEADWLGAFLLPLILITREGQLSLDTVSERQYPADREIDLRFRAARLQIRSGERWRLVHEAVIEHWPRAAAWLDEWRPLLRIEAAMLLDAEAWHGHERRETYLPRGKTQRKQAIKDAARILMAYRRSFSLRRDSILTGPRALVKDYCLTLLELDRTPLQTVEHNHKVRCHVHLAAAYGRIGLLEIYRQIDASCLDYADSMGRTPLDHAAWSDADTVAYLLRHGADPLHTDDEGWPPISAAIMMGNDAIFTQLLPYYKAGAVERESAIELLVLCAGRGPLDFSKKIIDRLQVDPHASNKEQWTPLLISASTGNLAAFDFFRQEQQKIEHRDGKNALHFACYSGHLEIVRLIIGDPDFEPAIDAFDGDGYTPLMYAAQRRHAEVVALLALVCQPNLADRRKGRTALHLAIAGDQQGGATITSGEAELAYRTVQALLRYQDIDLNAQQGNQLTPFELARSHPRIRHLLLSQANFDPAKADARGWTPLMHAAHENQRAMVRAILAEPAGRASIAHLAADGMTAARLMIEQGMADIVASLIEAGDFDPWDGPGFDFHLLGAAIAERALSLVALILARLPARRDGPLRHMLDEALAPAIGGGDGDLLERLFEAGADPNAVIGEAGRRPLHLAAITGRRALYDCVLRQADVNPAIPDNWGRLPLADAPEAWSGAEPVNRYAFKPVSWSYLLDDEGWLPSRDRAQLLKGMHAAGGAGPHMEAMEIMERVLPFYPGARLIRLADAGADQARRRLFYIEWESRFFFLDGGSKPLHDLNRLVPLRLNEHNLSDYLIFFCIAIRGENGPFLILDTTDNRHWPPSFRSADGALLPGLYRPPRGFGRSENNGWRLSALLAYGDMLSHGDFEIMPDGEVTMLHDEVVQAELPDNPALMLGLLPARP